MTWLGDPKAKISDTARDKLLATRANLEKQIKELSAKGPAGRYPHQIRHHQEDILKLANQMTKIDQRLGRPVDRFSGG